MMCWQQFTVRDSPVGCAPSAPTNSESIRLWRSGADNSLRDSIRDNYAREAILRYIDVIEDTRAAVAAGVALSLPTISVFAKLFHNAGLWNCGKRPRVG